jgi:hypothetical protein
MPGLQQDNRILSANLISYLYIYIKFSIFVVVCECTVVLILVKFLCQMSGSIYVLSVK